MAWSTVIVGNGTRASVHNNIIAALGGQFDTSGYFKSQAPASASATGTTGTITWDASYVYVCVATNTWVRYPLNQSIYFDGADDKITAPGTGLGGAVTEVTLSAWIKLDTLGSIRAITQEVKSDGTGNSPFYFRTRAVNTLRFGMTGGTTPLIDSSTALLANTWYHVLAQRKFSDSKLYLYLNGVSDATAVSFTDGDFSATGPTLYIGHNQAGAVLWDGLIKDVRVFNVAISTGDITKLASVANQGKLPSEISGFSATNASQVRFYSFNNVDNAQINSAGAINDYGADGLDATGANFAGTAASGVTWEIAA